eukprot:m.25158 g.25158  ORF g.25158 m.25158 type:complete len:149 (+) comp28751_c0_seq2:1066-1512(+)
MTTVSRLIRTALDAEGLSRDQVKQFRYQLVYGHGRLRCSGGNGLNHSPNSWSSHLAWIKIDLIGRRIVKNYSQECQTCRDKRRPYVSQDELERMIEVVVERVARLIDGPYDSYDENDVDYSESERPHRQELCERCTDKGSPCWIPRRR